MNNLAPAEYIEPTTGETLSAVYIWPEGKISVAIEDKEHQEVFSAPQQSLQAALSLINKMRSMQPDYVTNPGPWEFWPASKHIVDAEGNTVCTIAPDCSNAAITVMSKAPEAVKMLGDLLTQLVAVITTDAVGEIALDNLMDEIKVAADFMKQFKTPCNGEA